MKEYTNRFEKEEEFTFRLSTLRKTYEQKLLKFIDKNDSDLAAELEILDLKISNLEKRYEAYVEETNQIIYG